MNIDGNLNRVFQDHLPTFHFQRVEPTGGIGVGVPDLNGCAQSVEFWLELKRVVGWSVTMRPPQIAWIERRTRAGGRVFIACRKRMPKHRRALACDDLWLLKPTAARLLASHNLKELPAEHIALICRDGPAQWDWPAISQLLLSR